MFQREQVEAVIDGGRGTHKDTCACHFLLDVGQFGTVIQTVFQQVRHETLVARQLVADTDERGTVGNAGIREHGTDFIHRPVGVRQQQDGGVRFAQGFFHHETQGTRGLSGTRRSHQQKVVFGLFLFQDEFVETTVIAVQFDILQLCRRTYAEQQFFPVGLCGQKSIQSTESVVGRSVRKIVFYGKHLFFAADDVFILLSVAQH